MVETRKLRTRRLELADGESVAVYCGTAGFPLQHIVRPASGASVRVRGSNEARPGDTWTDSATAPTISEATPIAENYPVNWLRYDATGGGAEIDFAYYGEITTHHSTDDPLVAPAAEMEVDGLAAVNIPANAGRDDYVVPVFLPRFFNYPKGALRYGLSGVPSQLIVSIRGDELLVRRNTESVAPYRFDVAATTPNGVTVAGTIRSDRRAA